MRGYECISVLKKRWREAERSGKSDFDRMFFLFLAFSTNSRRFHSRRAHSRTFSWQGLSELSSMCFQRTNDNCPFLEGFISIIFECTAINIYKKKLTFSGSWGKYLANIGNLKKLGESCPIEKMSPEPLQQWAGVPWKPLEESSDSFVQACVRF